MNAQSKFEQWYGMERRSCGITVTSKDLCWSPLWKTIHWILKIITFGKQNRFYDGFTTTVGNIIFFPAGWRFENSSAGNCVTLKHECDHVRWYLKWGAGNVWLGTFMAGLLYLLFPLPLGLAWYRYMFERRGYRASYYAALELGLKPDIEYYVQQLTGPNYLWTWPFKQSVRAWFRVNCQPAKLDQFSTSLRFSK